MRGNLERYSFPRLQMLLLVSLTGLAGFLASFTLLQLGMLSMGLRYLVAFGFAYTVFLILLWVWLQTRSEDYADAANLGDFSSGSGNAQGGDHFSGGGGSGGGGGASGHFDSPAVGLHSDMHGGGVGDAVDSVGDVVGAADELAIPLVLLFFIGALFLSSMWVVYSAPLLFAELLVDGVLTVGLYRRLRGIESRHWLETAIKRTVWPFAMTGVLVFACGWGMQLYAPEAHTIGQVVVHVKEGGRD